MILYRPINQDELNLIIDSGWKKFPDRLPQQPIFYPVLSLDYARKIHKWNLDSYGNGFIVEFQIDDDYISNFDVHNVGGKNDNEYWIPSEELDNFNNNMIGNIKYLEGWLTIQ